MWLFLSKTQRHKYLVAHNPELLYSCFILLSHTVFHSYWNAYIVDGHICNINSMSTNSSFMMNYSSRYVCIICQNKWIRYHAFIVGTKKKIKCLVDKNNVNGHEKLLIPGIFLMIKTFFIWKSQSKIALNY